jgi:hypothetical protein
MRRWPRRARSRSGACFDCHSNLHRNAKLSTAQQAALAAGLEATIAASPSGR